MNSRNAGMALVFHGVIIILTGIRQEWDAARTAANEIFTRPLSGPIHLAMAQIRRRVDTAYSKMQNAESYVESLENSLDIEKRWTEDSAEYKVFYQENVLTNYERALDELERLVVMRLFELTKMSSSGTGLSIQWSNRRLLYVQQVTGYVVKLGKHSNGGRRPSGMQSVGTIYKLPNLLPHVLHYRGRKLWIMASWANSTFSGIPKMTSIISHGHKLCSVKLQ